MTNAELQYGDPEYHRRYIIGLVHELAFDPDEAIEAAHISGKPAHPTILLDNLGEIEFFYSQGWKSYFSAEEQAAIERHIARENALPSPEDEVWEDITATTPIWTEVRQYARELITALGGLPENLAGRWAKK